MSRMPIRPGVASLSSLALALCIAGSLSGQAVHAGDYARQVAVVAGLSGAQLSYLGLPTDTEVAESFHAVASRLHATRERWDDAALLHVFAANLRGPADPKSLTDLLLAADLFAATGETEATCAALERAAAIAVRVGRLGDARYCHKRAKLIGTSGCSGAEGAPFAEMLVPTPGPISVESPSPQTGPASSSHSIHLPAAPGPIIVDIHLPAAPGPIIVDPPDLVDPVWSEAEAGLTAPILTPPGIARPEV